jgi:alpha-ketoglutarate-dependent taurine dioxygenase
MLSRRQDRLGRSLWFDGLQRYDANVMTTDDEPSVSKSTGAGLTRQLNAFGYSILRGAARGVATDAFAALLGKPIAPWGNGCIQRLFPKATSTPNTYSGIFGLGRFPLHSDLAHWPVPPRYLLLRCVKGYADVPTLLLDGLDLASEIGTGSMARALVRPRRLCSGEMRLLRLLEDGRDGRIVRWDEVFLKPASRVGSETFKQMRSLLESCEPTPVEMVDNGDVLIVDNWRMLHSRPAVPDGRTDRVLERVYLRSLR